MVAALLAALADPVADVRRSAALALSEASGSDPAVVTALLAALTDPADDVREFAAQTLTNIPIAREDVDTALAGIIESIKKEDIRRNICHVLGERGIATSTAINALTGRLLDVDNGVRRVAAKALAQLGQRFPAQRSEIENLLIRTIANPKFEERDGLEQQTGQDYAFGGLWALVSETSMD